MQKLLNCAAAPAAVAKAVSSWDALELNAAIDEHRLCGRMVRTDAGTSYVRASLCHSGLIIYRQGNVGYEIGGLYSSASELGTLLAGNHPAAQPYRGKPTPAVGGVRPVWLWSGLLPGRPGAVKIAWR